MATLSGARFPGWTPAVHRVLRRAVTLAGTGPVGVVTIVDALDSDALPAPDAALPLGVGAELDGPAGGVLRAANRLRLAAGRSTIHLVDLVGALADAAFIHPAPDLVGRRRFLCERLVSLTGASPGAAPALLRVATEFGDPPSLLLSR